MINKYGVFFTCMKEGKFYHHYAEGETMVDVARCLITFKPRKGWNVVKVEISEAEQLEMELFDKRRWRIDSFHDNRYFKCVRFMCLWCN